MIFTSFKFLVFIAVVFVVYFAIPKKVRWVWLSASSIYFYLCAGIKYSVFLLFSTLSAYFFSLYIGKCDKTLNECTLPREEKKLLRKKLDKRKHTAIALTLLLNLGILGFLKYAGFILHNIEAVTRLFIPSFETVKLSFVLPLGISFYTFMTAGYCIDVYRGTTEPERNPLKLMLFLSYFPHIMQGPIDRYEDTAPTLFEGHSFDFTRLTEGLRRIIWGFFQKLVIADRLGMLVNEIFSNSASYSGWYLVIAVFFYAVQIYADFAGYMDIAIGVSRVLGVEIAENFNAPYFASSIPDFWRRWHMTLGSWFRDYLFYPVMRSRLLKSLSKSLKKKYSLAVAGTVSSCIALAVVWLTTGIWHGAAWNYIAWGGYYGILIISSTVFKPLYDKVKINRDRWFYKVYMTLKTFLLVLVGYIFFRADSMSHAFSIIGRVFTRFLPVHNAPGVTLGLDMPDMVVAICATAILLLADILKLCKKDVGSVVAKMPLPIRWLILYIGILSIVIFGIYGPGYDAASFIYFNF